jgi:hypothetical protein
LVCPLLIEGADESLCLAIPAWCAWWDQDVACVEVGERGAELAASSVAHRVVGHDRLDWPGALLCHPGRCAQQDGGSDLTAIVAVHLDVGQP